MTTVGGQAVLEGVMMRGPSNWSVAVRKPDGEIAHVNQPIASPMARHRIWRLPVIRGVIALGESLAIGFRALAISASYAAQEEGEEGEAIQTELTRGQLFFAFAIAIGFAVLLFKVSPALITDWIGINAGWFVIVEGLIRVGIFIAYLTLISLFPDLRRVFQYHAAEHKAINAYEAGEELIAGLAYELIRFAGKHQRNRILMTLLAPGLWLQRLTTRQPSLEQIEVSIRALKEVLALEGTHDPNERKVEVMA
jgi:uncharacterized protein YqhQ